MRIKPLSFPFLTFERLKKKGTHFRSGLFKTLFLYYYSLLKGFLLVAGIFHLVLKREGGQRVLKIAILMKRTAPLKNWAALSASFAAELTVQIDFFSPLFFKGK